MMEVPSADGERGVEAGPLAANADKLAITWSSHARSSPTSVKTTGCVLVKVARDGMTTKLVYLDDEIGQPRTADEQRVVPARPSPR